MAENSAPAAGEERRLSPLERRALDQMRASTAQGYDPYYRFQYRYVRPSPGRYVWQWFWDSCFHAVVNARLDPDLARDELRSLVVPHEPDGMIGHMTYWGPLGAFFAALFMQGRLLQWRRRHTALIQPPVIAQAVEEVWSATGDRAFVEEMLPELAHYYDWLGVARDPDHTGLIAIISPFEAGLDNSPAFDAVLGLRNPRRRGLLVANRLLDLRNLFLGGNYDLPTIFRRDRFVVYDTFVTATYADGLRSLARLYRATGDPEQASRADDTATRVEAALNERCWDSNAGLYTSLAGRDQTPIRVSTIASIYPLVLDTTPNDRRAAVVERHLTNVAEFGTDFPVPTVARSEPSFDPSGEGMIWRGPMAMCTNWLMVRGLRRHGFTAEAARIADRSLEAAEAHGFREFYNPLTGVGMRGTNFGWGALAVAMQTSEI